MAEEAVLVLRDVKVDGRNALVSVLADRLEVADGTGTRVIGIGELARIAHKAGLRTGRIILTMHDGTQVVIKGIRSRDTPTAYNILVRLATSPP